MNRRSFLASSATTAVAALMLGGGLAPLVHAAQFGSPEDARLSALLDRIFAALLERSPELATGLGLDKDGRAGAKSQLSDYSAAMRAKDLAETEAQLAELHRLDRAKLSPAATIHYDIVDYLLSSGAAARKRFGR